MTFCELDAHNLPSGRPLLLILLAIFLTRVFLKGVLGGWKRRVGGGGVRVISFHHM